MKRTLLAIILASISLPALHAQVTMEFGYFHTFHLQPPAELHDWIEVPSSWQSGTQFPGDSEHSHRFRDTTWLYHFNSSHPLINVQVPLWQGDKAKWVLHEAMMINSWGELSFMFGGEWSYKHNDRLESALQLGFLTGYGMLNELEGASIKPIMGGDVIFGPNYTLTYTLGDHWRTRLYLNHALLGLGLHYQITLPGA